MKITIFTFMVGILFLLSACAKENRIYQTLISEEDVVILSIYASCGDERNGFGLINLGHSFLSLENIGSAPVDIGNYRLQPQEIITMGTWSILDYFGVWYNIEANYIKLRGKYSDRVSVSCGLNLEELNRFNDYLATKPKWSILKNCTFFAIKIWNEVAESTEILDEPLIFTPKKLAENIKKFPNFDVKKEVTPNEIMGFYQDKKFISYRLEEVYYA